MDTDGLLEQIAQTRNKLFVEGHLNENFTILENFAKEYNMKSFVKEAVESYFERSASVLTSLDQELGKVPYNFCVLERLFNQIRKYTMSIGANNILIKLYRLRELLYNRQDTQSCQSALREVKLERERFKSRMDLYFGMKDPEEQTSDEESGHDEDSRTDDDVKNEDHDDVKNEGDRCDEHYQSASFALVFI